MLDAFSSVVVPNTVLLALALDLMTAFGWLRRTIFDRTSKTPRAN